MTTMLDRALDLLRSDPTRAITLEELRKFAGVALRTRGRLCNQLRDCPEVVEVGGAKFQYLSE